MIRLHFRSICALVAASLPLALLAGCGSGGDAFPSLAQGPGGSTATTLPGPYGSYTGTDGGNGIENPVFTTRYYQSTWTVSGGTATANVTAQPDGSASGTLTIDNGQTASTRAVVGTGNVTGTVNFSTGTVNLSGSITQQGQTTPINITGTAPGASGTGGNSSLQLGQTFYTSQWVVSTNGPITGNNNNGGNASGGASSLTFSSNSSNITGGNLNGAASTATLQTIPFLGSLLSISTVDVVNGAPRSVTISITDANLGVGSTYALSDDADTTVLYSEGMPNSVKAFGSKSGTVQVTAINGKEYTLKLTGVRVEALKTVPVYTGTGAFTIDGTITATLP